MPGDILGVSVFDRNTGGFAFHPGSIFTQVFLADEINRATPKSQSALLEAMEEEQVTVEGSTRPLNSPFFVIATQNPLEQAGTFPLPESQMDRFLMRISLGYPDREAENHILQGRHSPPVMNGEGACLPPEQVPVIQAEVDQIHASDHFLSYLQDILEFSRTSGRFEIGLSPRAGLSLLKASRAWARICGRDHTLPEDLQHVLPWVAAHRLALSQGMGRCSPDEIRAEFQQVPVPV